MCVLHQRMTGNKTISLNIVLSYYIYFLDSVVVVLVAPAILTTCRYANMIGFVFNNSLENTRLCCY